MNSYIPLILHQTYKDNNIPSSLRKFQSSWRNYNPNWEYRFWDDNAIRSFFKLYYPSFLTIFDAYPQTIMRVDAFRYFLLYHYGGIYADMDFECLHNMDEILENKDILLIPEPQDHFQKNKAKIRNLDYIVSNALMASKARHPFWLRVINLLQQNKDEIDVLDATGPFMLTAAYSDFSPKLSLSKGRYFGEISSDDKGHKSYKDERTHLQTYARHHWVGSWWKKNIFSQYCKDIIKSLRDTIMPRFFFNFYIRSYLNKHPQPANNNFVVRHRDSTDDNKEVRALVLNKGIIYSDETINIQELINNRPDKKNNSLNLPLVSALLVTKDRPFAAIKSIECFLSQTYPNKEMIIIDEGGNKLQKEVQKLNEPTILYYRNDKETSLGKLRNRSINLAKGEYICQWDDDDLFHPRRIEYQIGVCLNYSADACFLLREMVLVDGKKSLAISDNRLWEGTIMAKKSSVFHYPHWARGEDYPAVRLLVNKRKVVALDYPELYIYTIHGNNTWDKKHMTQLWHNATKRYFLTQDIAKKFAELKQNYPHLS